MPTPGQLPQAHPSARSTETTCQHFSLDKGSLVDRHQPFHFTLTSATSSALKPAVWWEVQAGGWC